MRRAHLSRARRAVLVVAGLLLVTPFAPVLQAQLEPTFTETVEVDLVNVEVWVNDKSGNAVSGLGADAFVLEHDGAPVEITHFSEIKNGMPQGSLEGEAVPATSASPAPERPHLVVVFDIFRLTQASQKRLVRDLRRFLASGAFPAEQVLILRLENGLSIASPFGASQSQIDEVLGHLEKRPSSSIDVAADHRQVVQMLEALWTDLNRMTGSASLRSVVSQVTGPSAREGALGTSGTEPGGPSAGGAAAGFACEDFVDRAEPTLFRWAEKDRIDTATTLSRLGDASSFLSGLDGPKTLIYLSDGLGLHPGVAATDFVRGVCPGFQTDLEIDTLPDPMDDSFENLARRMSSNRIIFHALQGSAPGKSISGGAGRTTADQHGFRSFERSLTTSAKKGLTLLAEETGGRVFLESADHEQALAEIAGDTRSYYSLAYTPPAPGTTRAHEISVRVTDPALSARHRRAYSDKTPDQWLTERLESALYLGMVTNPLAIRLGAGQVTAKEGVICSLPLHVMVPVERLAFTERSGASMSQLLIRVMALSEATRSLVVTDRPMFLPQPGPGSLETFDLRLDLELEAGVQMMAIAVQDKISGETSFVSTTLEVVPSESSS